ncbi:MAG TPA: hypothetical protein VNZ53_48395, partial [Steroidobacteraceae bacterium]|nr:hypothetical protein [Steroidobacteraceae bacterium]
MMAERDGFLRSDKREHAIKDILEFSRDAGIVRKGIPAHEQVMVAMMAFFGIAMGPPDGKVQYISRSGTDSGGSATSL